MTRTIYKLRDHESAQAHVEIIHDEQGMISEIQFWSYSTLVISCYKARKFVSGVFTGEYIWVLKCTGTYSQTTARQITWFTRMPWNAKSTKWALSRQLMVDVFNHDWNLKDADETESNNIEDLIRWYMYYGTKCRTHG